MSFGGRPVGVIKEADGVSFVVPPGISGGAFLEVVSGEKTEPRARPVLKLDEDEILTIGEPAPPRLGPAVESGDLASAGRTGMSGTGFLITARPPKKKTPVPLPPPPPQD